MTVTPLTDVTITYIDGTAHITGPDIKLNTEEKRRLYKIDDATMYLTRSVSEYFKKAGKAKAFAAAPTDAEQEAQRVAKNVNRYILWMSDTQSDLARLRAKDIFMGVALRVAANDTDLADLLPSTKKYNGRHIKYGKKDVDVLKKCQLNTLASLVEARL